MVGLKSVFTKSYIDCECPNLDLYKFHPQLKIFLVMNGIFFNNPDSSIRLIWPFLCIIMSLMGSCLEVTFIYHGVEVKDYSFATECFCYLMIITSVPVVNTSVLFNRTKLVDLLNSMNKNFLYICQLGARYRTSFLKGQLLIWQLCIVWFSFVTSVALSYSARTIGLLTYQSLFATQTENTVRPLIFPVWLPQCDPHRTPIYEVFIVWEIILMLIVLQTFCVYIYVLFHVLLHNYYLMTMMIFDCEVLFDDLDDSVVKLSKYDSRRIEVQSVLNSRMRRIVEWHNLVFESIDAVSSVYGPPLINQLTCSSIPIALTAYQVADSLEHGEFHFLFVMVGIATCVQLWIPCYLGTLIRNKAFAVGDAIWDSGWQYKPLGQLVRQDIILVIMRSQMPLTIQFTGLPPLELETFSSIMSAAYSYFNVLRQYTG